MSAIDWAVALIMRPKNQWSYWFPNAWSIVGKAAWFTFPGPVWVIDTLTVSDWIIEASTQVKLGSQKTLNVTFSYRDNASKAATPPARSYDSTEGPRRYGRVATTLAVPGTWDESVIQQLDADIPTTETGLPFGTLMPLEIGSSTPWGELGLINSNQLNESSLSGSVHSSGSSRSASHSLNAGHSITHSASGLFQIMTSI